MVDLTVVILTKNEEKNIRKCVESFRGVGKRFVVVDSFSDDNTESICRQLNMELRTIGASLDFFQNKWISYSDQFNWGLNHTCIKTKWTMRMDADEELLPELADEIESQLSVDISEEITGIVLKRRLIFMGKWIKHGGRYPEYLLRIWRTGKAICEPKIMDEHMIISEGKLMLLKNDLLDNNQKDLEWWTAKHNWYSNREVLDYQLMMSGRNDELEEHHGASSFQAVLKRKMKRFGYYRMPRFMRARLYYVYRYYFRLGFLDGHEGKIYHFLQAYWYRFLVDAKMYECEKKDTTMKPQGDLKT